jgi:calcineurin-like phosphoesterase family protein
MTKYEDFDYYEVLQVDPSAEPDIIEATYKKLARKYHPDVNKTPSSLARMKRINIAHDILSDTLQREQYHAEWLRRKHYKTNTPTPTYRPTMIKMQTFMTSDLHLGHGNIIRYCNRPFKDANGRITQITIKKMDDTLLKNWNKAVSQNDTIYHIGDFSLTHDSGVYGGLMKRVHGQTAFLRGNHDNGLRNASYYICKNINGVKVFMRHWPPWELTHGKFAHHFEIPSDIDIILCGHVHDKWKFHTHNVGNRHIPVINVSTDVWGYKPAKLADIIKCAERGK